MQLQLLWTAATPFPLCITGALETRWMRCLERSFILDHQGLALYSVLPPIPVCLCRPCWFCCVRKARAAKLHTVAASNNGDHVEIALSLLVLRPFRIRIPNMIQVKIQSLTQIRKQQFSGKSQNEKDLKTFQNHNTKSPLQSVSMVDAQLQTSKENKGRREINKGN